MLKRIIILAAALGISGCTPGYRVYVNGYAEGTAAIERHATLYVAADPNSPNPIFEKQIKAGAETLLRDYGYTIAEEPGTADYQVTFQHGMKSETVMGYTPAYRPHFGARGGYPDALLFGRSTYTPYMDTLYDQWLTLRLFAAGPTDAKAPNPVWVGEATMSTDRAELRETVNYLLIGCIEYLGVDTERKVALTIRKDDPRLAPVGDR
jgi:hypothetical protein